MKKLKLKREEELLLYCACSKMDEALKTKIISLVEKVDWNYLLDIATRHRLNPFYIIILIKFVRRRFLMRF